MTLCILAMLAGAAESDGPDAPPLEDDVSEVPVGPDRSGPPAVASPSLLELPEPEVHRLSDHVEVHLVAVPAVRKVEIAILPTQGQADLQNGALYEAALGYLIDAATGVHDSSELSTLEDLHEIDVYSSMYTHYGLLGLEAPKEELARGLGLLEEMVLEPAFPKAEVKRYVVDQLQYYQVRGPSQPDAVAGSLLAYGWFPPDHPYGERPDLELLDAVKGKALAGSYTEWLASGPIRVLVVGDVVWSDVEVPLTRMLAGLGGPGDGVVELDAPAPSGTRVLASNLPGQEQVAIRLRMPAPALSADDAAAAWGGSFVLGGHFLSRLNSNLREEKGWTYGARAGMSTGTHFGTLSVRVDVKVENLAGAVREIEAELQRLVDEGVTAEELDLAYRSQAADWNEARMTADSAMSRYRGAFADNETLVARRARYAALAEVTPEQVKATAATHWAAEGSRLWVLVGDEAAMAPQLQELGWSAEWVPPSDAILGKVPPATP